jgi:hypothetical protein
MRQALVATPALLLLASAACHPAPEVVTTPAAPPPSKPLHHVTAAECGACHEQIYREWQGSQHAKANPLKDPIHGAMYRRMVGDPTSAGVTQGGGPPHCPACHVVAAALDGTSKLDAEPVYLDGVTCTTCHTLTGRKGGGESRGVHSYTRSTDHLQGPRFAGRGSARFPMERRGAWFASPDLCLGCHGHHTNKQGVGVCRSGDEAAHGGAAPCQACHMAVRDGHADHSMLGGHSDAMVARAASIEVAARRAGAGVEARVTLRSRVAHAFPTGAPFRMGMLEVVGLDGGGREVWRSCPGKGRGPDGHLMVRLTDDAGRPAPPPRATRVAADNRLAPGEVREITYHLPAAVVRVRARLLYRLVPPAMAAKLGDRLPAELKRPKLVAEAEAVVE